MMGVHEKVSIEHSECCVGHEQGHEVPTGIRRKCQSTQSKQSKQKASSSYMQEHLAHSCSLCEEKQPANLSATAQEVMLIRSALSRLKNRREASQPLVRLWNCLSLTILSAVSCPVIFAFRPFSPAYPICTPCIGLGAPNPFA